MRSNVERLPDEQFYWFALSRPAGRVSFAPPHVQCEFHGAPAKGNVRLHLNRFWRWYQRRIWSGQTATLLAQRIQSLQPRVIWLMADYGLAPLGLRLLPSLAGRRVHVSIHDDLAPSAEREGFSTPFLHEIAAFQTGLRQLDFTADAVSEELMEAVTPTARRKVIVTMPVNDATCAPALIAPRREGPLTIGFSGNFMGQEEFVCFVEGLKLWSQRSRRDWRLRAFGNVGLRQLDPRIEAHGFTPVEEVRRALRDCDLLLLPSPLDRPEMRTNMPTKLVTYLECGRLVFAFAPAQSATERVISEHSIGVVATERQPELVAQQIEKLCAWEMTKAEQGWQSLLHERFNEQRIQRDLAVALAD